MEELEADYYLTNFRILVDFVRAHHADLLSPVETAFGRTFGELSEDASRLYVRLIMRKGPHFRADKLAYSEIEDLHGAARQLIDAGLLAMDYPDEPAQLVALCNRTELAGILAHKGAVKSLRKPELVDLAATHYQAGALTLPFHWYTPLKTEVLVVYRLLFFGNLSQDLTEFVLLDLGLLRYETVTITAEDRLFTHRAMLEDTIRYRLLREAVYLALEADDGEAAQALLQDPPPTHDSPSLLRRRDRLINEAGRYLERRKQDEAALAMYQKADSPPARERRARILERNGLHGESLALCDAIVADPRDENELGFAKRFRGKLGKKLGLDIKAPARRNHPVLKLEIPAEANVRVEELVLKHQAGQDVIGFYAENLFWLGWFGLTFWDIIYKPIPGAFFNHYQRGPKDLFSPLFRQARSDAISQRLQQIIHDPDWPKDVLETYRSKHGIANYLVHWRYLSQANLELALERINRKHVAAIFDRLSRDPGEFKTGFPDLILFPDNEAGYELVEVKGPGDQLQENQRRWLAWFADHQIPYRVAKVTWAD